MQNEDFTFYKYAFFSTQYTATNAGLCILLLILTQSLTNISIEFVFWLPPT